MSKKNKRRGLLAIELSSRTRIIIAIAAAIVVLLAVVITVLVMLVNQTKPADSATPLTEEQKRQAYIADTNHLADTIKSAQNAMERGDSGRVDEIYQAEVKNEPDTTKKVKLLLDESRVYYFGGRSDKAVQVAKTADGLMDDKFLVADWLSQLYDINKQYSLAAQYYTLAAKWSTSPNNNAGLAKSFYDQKAAQALAKAGK